MALPRLVGRQEKVLERAVGLEQPEGVGVLVMPE